jgi:hypothetical protein
VKFNYLLAVVLVGVLVAGCGSEEVVSVSLDREITVDGDSDDWQGILRFNEDANLSYGLANDENVMYIVIVVGDRDVRRQIIMSGLYLWFDPAGEESRRFGLRFPIGLQEDVEDMMAMMREQDPNKLAESFDETVKEFLVIGPHDTDWRRAGVNTVDGIEMAATADASKLVLEFMVPVTNDGQYGYGIGAVPGDAISLGVQTPEFDRDAMRQQMQSDAGGRGGKGGGGGGAHGGGGRGGGGRGGMGGGGTSGTQRPDVPDPIKVWTTVRLAK